MLYRVQPGSEMMWSDNDTSMMIWARGGVDLDRLEWQSVQAEHRDAEVIAVALRHGTKTRTGIVFPARFLNVVERPGTLMRDYRTMDHTPGSATSQTARERREHVSSSSTQKGLNKDQAVWQAFRAAVLAAEQHAADLMSHPVREDLSSWWKERGGVFE